MSKYSEWERRIKLILAEEAGEDPGENIDGALPIPLGSSLGAGVKPSKMVSQFIKSQPEYTRKFEEGYAPIAKSVLLDSGYVATPFISLASTSSEPYEYFDAAKVSFSSTSGFSSTDWGESGTASIVDVAVEVDGVRGLEKTIKFRITLACGRCSSKTEYTLIVFARECKDPNWDREKFVGSIIRLKCNCCSTIIDSIEPGTTRAINNIDAMLKAYTLSR